MAEIKIPLLAIGAGPWVSTQILRTSHCTSNVKMVVNHEGTFVSNAEALIIIPILSEMLYFKIHKIVVTKTKFDSSQVIEKRNTIVHTL